MGKKHKIIFIVLSILLLVTFLYIFSERLLTAVGEMLIVDEEPVSSDAVVILNTGMEYYPRLMEAAGLYRNGFAKKVVINGNRKTEVLRQLEKRGFKPCCPWYEERIRILVLLGVPRRDIVPVSAENAYDTISEAKAVGKELIEAGMRRIIITTSKSHTRRARHIWQSLYPDELRMRMVAASDDPYSPKRWWKEGRQIKWVLAEYGAFLYCWWKL